VQQRRGARQPVVQVVAFADRRACNGKQIDRRLQQLPEPFRENALPKGKTVEDRAIAGTKSLLRGLHRTISSPVRFDTTTNCTKLFR